jgi:hypothetical protein
LFFHDSIFLLDSSTSYEGSPKSSPNHHEFVTGRKGRSKKLKKNKYEQLKDHNNHDDDIEFVTINLGQPGVKLPNNPNPSLNNYQPPSRESSAGSGVEYRSNGTDNESNGSVTGLIGQAIDDLKKSLLDKKNFGSKGYLEFVSRDPSERFAVVPLKLSAQVTLTFRRLKYVERELKDLNNQVM